VRGANLKTRAPCENQETGPKTNVYEKGRIAYFIILCLKVLVYNFVSTVESAITSPLSSAFEQFCI